jgi:hypothetical protein
MNTTVQKLFLVLALALPLSAAAQATNPNDPPVTQSQLQQVIDTQNAAAEAAAANSTPQAQAAQASQNYQFARQGVFGCNLTGSYAMSVGAMSAVGGVYVPVNDAAVTLNTGYLVYKECVLRGIVDRERESALAALIKQLMITLQTGRGGNPTFWQSQKENLTRADQAYLTFVQQRSAGLNPAFQSKLVRSEARDYMANTRQPSTAYDCPYKGDMRRVWNGDDTSDAAMAALRDGRCDPFVARAAFRSAANEYVARDQEEMMWRLTVNGGFYDVDSVDANNQRIVLTPGSLNQSVAQQAVTSGFRQTENANDIDQMIGALFAGLGTQIMSSAKGLIGLTQKIGSQPSYLNQVAAESAAGLRNSAANAAIQILSAALTVEKSYNGTVSAIATTLTSTITQLRATENQCWTLVVSKVCSTPLQADNTCQYQGPCTNTTGVGNGTFGSQTQSCPPPITLKVATTTQASQQVIDSQVTPLANQTVSNINSSNSALKLINQLVSGVTNTTSVDAQRIALVQLDQLVSQGALHNQTQLTTVQQQQAAIKDAMSSLYNDTKTAWGDSTDPNIGWCNVNSQSVIDMWIQRWRQ